MPIKYLLLVSCFFTSPFAMSHGGGLNIEGCHNEAKTGGYHCHGSAKSSISPANTIYKAKYNRTDFNYVSYPSSTSIGFYTKEVCSQMNIDHVVSLKDAYESGAYKWSTVEKTAFGNDRENHVSSCSRINSSKGSARPEKFLSRSRDGKGYDYRIEGFCNYLEKYYNIKIKYALSFSSNRTSIFEACGINI